MRNKRWVRLLAYVTGSVNQELLLQNEYLAAENRILRAKLPTKLRLNNPERATLAEIGKRLGRKVLGEVACVAKPDTILAWYRRLVAKKFDGSKHRQYPERPAVPQEVEVLVVRMARENSGWGYDRIVGALANLGHHLSDQTIGNILRRHGIAPAPKRNRTTSWKDFISAHKDVLAVLTSLLWKCSLYEDWSPTIRITSGWNRSPAARPRRPGGTFIHAGIFCMIATRSSAHRFDRCWWRAA
jgi:putative transposase